MIVVVMLQLLVSCKGDGSKFVGNWAGGGAYTLNITKSGKNFILKFADWAPMSASYNDANDKLTANDGNHSYDIIIDENTKYLLFNGIQFKKQ